MDPQDPQHDDLLARAPEKIIRNSNAKGKAAYDRFAQEYIRAGARLVAEPANPALSAERLPAEMASPAANMLTRQAQDR